MDQEPKLRSIPPGGFASRQTTTRDSQGRLQLALGVALAIALVLLVWSYFSLGSRIDALENETRTLRQAVAERDDLINAQRARLDEVRGHLQELLQLVDAPLPGSAPASPAAPTSTSASPPPESP
ncbi:MAG TPA: hypothetical protein VMR50_17295 [Myxococcota bacterium]|nr:hypothetical protein [Myxococcota bacterium]